ncbi:MAG: RNA polymerase sigma-70 factor [Bacteroidota bacterium]
MSIQPLFSDDELLAGISKGDQQAFRLLYERYTDPVYIQALRLLRSEELAQELMQEVFLKLWRMGKNIIEIQNLEVYLKKMTRNHSLNELRRILRENKTSQGYLEDYMESHNDTEEGIILKETRQVLQTAIALLPAQQKAVYQLCYQEGLKYKEAAERLNLPHSTVQSHMKRALQFLRAYLKDHPDLAAIIILFKLF